MGFFYVLLFSTRASSQEPSSVVTTFISISIRVHNLSLYVYSELSGSFLAPAGEFLFFECVIHQNAKSVVFKAACG